MSKKPVTKKAEAEKAVKDICRATRKIRKRVLAPTFQVLP